MEENFVLKKEQIQLLWRAESTACTRKSAGLLSYLHYGTVEPLNKVHIGIRSTVLYREPVNMFNCPSYKGFLSGVSIV